MAASQSISHRAPPVQSFSVVFLVPCCRLSALEHARRKEALAAARPEATVGDYLRHDEPRTASRLLSKRVADDQQYARLP